MEPKRQKLESDKVNETNYAAWNFNDFPNEIIEKIFSYFTQNQLGQIARVCKKWKALTKSPVLWRKVNVNIFCSPDEEKNAESFKSFIDGLPSGVTFIRLDFSERAIFYMHLDFMELCMKLHHSCSHVGVLILTCCSISTGLSEVINSCTQILQGLKKLVLHSCLFNLHSGTEELKDNSKIEVLHLNCSGISSSRKIQFSKLRSLTELRLAETTVDDDWFLGDISLLNTLQVLDLQNTWITARIFLAIQRHGQNLKELYFCNLLLVDRGLNFNNPVFLHLKTICLSGTGVTCEGLVSLVRLCRSLVSVYVDEDVARSFAEHPFIVANRCKSGIVKSVDRDHNHNVDYSHS